MQTAREESSIIIFGETLLKRESAAEQSDCRESAEAIVPSSKQPRREGLNPAWATTQNSEHIAAEPRSTEMYEASTEEWKAAQDRIHVTERRSCQGICRGGIKGLRQEH